MTATITLTIDEDLQRLRVHLHDAGREPFLYMDETFDEMQAAGFKAFSRMLGRNLIFGNPRLLTLFEHEIREANVEGATGAGPVSADQLEQAIFAELSERRKKVAMIVMEATRKFVGFWEEGSEVHAKIDRALSALAERDDVLVFGDIRQWRLSEMARKQDLGQSGKFTPEETDP